MEFNFNKLFTGGGGRQKTVVGFEELSRLFSGNTAWSKSGQMKQYSKSLYVFAAVNKIAVKVSDVDLQLFQITSRQGDTLEVLNHEVLDVLTKINPFQTRSEFLKTAWINKKVTGEAFWLKVRNDAGKVVELWNLRPDLMTVVSDSELYIKHYEFQKSGGEKVVLPTEDVIHFKDPDPLNPFRGLSPLVSAKARIETEEFATNYQREFFVNNARPDALLVTENSLDTDQRTQMTSAWEERHAGEENNSKIGILEGGMKYQQVSISQKEMDFIESMKFTRDDILVALGVPKSIVTTDDVNYANADAGIKIFLSETIRPELTQLVEVLNEFLVGREFGEQYFLNYIDPTPSDRTALREDSTAGYGKWLTTNEIRQMNNLPDIVDGDSIAIINPVTGEENVNESKQVKYAVTDKVRNMALKHLQGRPMLRARFEIAESLKVSMMQDIKRARKKKVAKKSTKKKIRTPQKKELVSMLTEQTARESYFDLVNKRIDRRAKSFERTLVAEFVSQEERVIKRLEILDEEEKGVHSKLNHAQIASVMDKGNETKLFAAIGLPFLLEFASDGGEDAAQLTDETFDMSEGLKESMESRSIFFASSVTDTTFKELTISLSEGVNEGEGIQSLKKRVKKIYKTATDSRAALIARTETTNANNEGIVAQFRASEVVQGKEWINAGDASVRAEHLSGSGVGGEIVGVDELFSNGLSYPQEPNCRCVIGPALFE